MTNAKRIRERNDVVTTVNRLLRDVVLQYRRPEYRSCDGVTLMVGPILSELGKDSASAHELIVSSGFPPDADVVGSITFWLWHKVRDSESGWLVRCLGETDDVGRVRCANMIPDVEFYLTASLAEANGGHKVVYPDRDDWLTLTQSTDDWELVTREVIEPKVPHSASQSPPLPTDDRFARLATLIASRSAQLGPALAELVGSPDSHTRRKMDFTETVAGAPPEVRTFSAGPAGKYLCEQDGDALCIQCDVSDIPHGLVWLGIEEANGTVTMHLPRLEQVAGRWVWRAAIRDLLDGRPAISPVETFPVPATALNRPAFACEEVRRFVDNLPAESEQGRRARDFLWNTNTVQPLHSARGGREASGE